MTTALLFLDVQRNMLEGSAPVPAAAEVKPALQSLLARARAADAMVVHVQNDGLVGEPDEPHTPGWELVFPPADGEPVVRKTESDAFAGTGLADLLRKACVRRVAVVGMQSNYCVAATSRGALRHGLEAILGSGAHATYDEEVSADAIAKHVEQDLGQDGVAVLPAAEIDFR